MSKPSDEPAGRTMVANISLSLDGQVNGPGGDYDVSWIVPHVLTDGAREHMVKVTGSASTALLGRKNYQGFASYCPPRWPVADDPDADSRDRVFARWLNAVEKVVFSGHRHQAGLDRPPLSGGDPAGQARRCRGGQSRDRRDLLPGQIGALPVQSGQEVPPRPAAPPRSRSAAVRDRRRAPAA